MENCHRLNLINILIICLSSSTPYTKQRLEIYELKQQMPRRSLALSEYHHDHCGPCTASSWKSHLVTFPL